MGTFYDYQPMMPQRIASEEEVAAMHAKLAAKVRNPTGESSLAATAPAGAGGAGSLPAASSQPSEAVQSPKEKVELIWNRPTTKIATAVKTNCGRYCCCKVTVDGKLHYELWKLTPGGGWFSRIDKGPGLKNFLEAQLLAEQDANQ